MERLQDLAVRQSCCTQHLCGIVANSHAKVTSTLASLAGHLINDFAQHQHSLLLAASPRLDGVSLVDYMKRAVLFETFFDGSVIETLLDMQSHNGTGIQVHIPAMRFIRLWC